ncbi:MAG TPA: hypothetical protein VHH53_11085, partial [Pseudonocardiaceae bacterium]|nr:hypothetical protein [Pseudonocardiaceae bacterium]
MAEADGPRIHRVCSSREVHLDQVERLLAVVSAEKAGWWRRLRLRFAARRLRRLAGGDGSPTAMRRAVRAARDQRDA